MASKTNAAIHIVREVLDGLAAPAVVSQALFEALQGPGPDPLSDPACIPEFITGPLRTALRKRLALATADEAIKMITERLTTMADSHVQPKPNGGVGHAAPTRGGLDATRQLSRQTVPLRTLVVATEERLANHLRFTFGSERIAAATASDPQQVEQVLLHMKPSIVVIDASRTPEEGLESLARILSQASDDTLRLVWGRPTLATQQLLAAMERKRASLTPLDPREGVDPLIDMFRARMG